jgi:hypothetical protein
MSTDTEKATASAPSDGSVQPASVWSPPFMDLVQREKLDHNAANDLFSVLNQSEIVLLADDSTSMATTISPALASIPSSASGSASAAPPTRWSELQHLAASIMSMTTAVNPDGFDIYFLNRAGMRHVKDRERLESLFTEFPQGETPLGSALKTIFADKLTGEQSIKAQKKHLLLIIATNGEPSDVTQNGLFSLISAQYTNDTYMTDHLHICYIKYAIDPSLNYTDTWPERLHHNHFISLYSYDTLLQQQKKKKKKLSAKKTKEPVLSYARYTQYMLIVSYQAHYQEMLLPPVAEPAACSIQ